MFFRVLGPLLGIQKDCLENASSLWASSEGNVANRVWAGVMGAGKGIRHM